MAANDVILLRVVGRYQQQNIVNTLHYQINMQTSTEAAVLGMFLTDWATANETAWLNCHIDTYELIGYKAFRVDGAAKIPAYQNRGVNGNVVGDEVPSNICRTITLYTASANHRRRGRVMLSGSEQGMFNLTDGAVTVAAVGVLQTLGDLLDSQLVGVADVFDPVLPASGVLPIEAVTKAVGRVTPSSVKSRRVSQYLIG